MSEKKLFIRNLILYGIIGSFTAFLDFCVFFMLTQYVGIHYMISNCISVLVGITTSFLLNRAYNFKVRDKVKLRFFIFLTVGICGLCLSNGILYVCIDIFDIEDPISKLVSILPVVLLQFIINKFITFRKRKQIYCSETINDEGEDISITM